MVRVLAGLDLDEAMPGYKHIIVSPQPGGNLTSARAELMTQYGSAASRWKLEAGRAQVIVRVPPNTRATVRLPGATLTEVTEGTRPVASAAGIASASQSGNVVVVAVGSGEYTCSYPSKVVAPPKTTGQ